jgi:hypothetical protein
LPIFDGGRLRAELGEASAGYDIAVAHYNQTLVNALKNISDQLIRRESMDKQQAFAAESVATAEDLRHRDGRLSARPHRLPQRAQCADLAVQTAASAATGAGGAECACRAGDGVGRLGAGNDVPTASRQAPKTPRLLRCTGKVALARAVQQTSAAAFWGASGSLATGFQLFPDFPK